MNYSKVLLISFCYAAAISCARAPVVNDYASGVQLSKSLVERYGALSSPDIEAYMAGLSRRLNSGLSAKNKSSYRITVLNLSSAQAFSPGGGFILVSRGLILSLQSEDELAFVIAHEMAHQELGHSSRPELQSKDGISDNSPESYRREVDRTVEFEADHFAAELLIRCSYNPVVASQAILHAASSRSDLSHDPNTMTFLRLRISKLALISQQQRTKSPTLVSDGRDFHRTQMQLQ